MSKLNQIKVGCSPLTRKIQLYRMGKDSHAALETKDVTEDAVSAVIEHLLSRPDGTAGMQCDYKGEPTTFTLEVTQRHGHHQVGAAKQLLQEVLSEVPHGWGASFRESDLYKRIKEHLGDAE